MHNAALPTSRQQLEVCYKIFAKKKSNQFSRLLNLRREICMILFCVFQHNSGTKV